MNPKATDFEEAAAPKDVPVILRNAAQAYRKSHGELESAWQEKGAGAVWSRIADQLERLAARIEKTTFGE